MKMTAKNLLFVIKDATNLFLICFYIVFYAVFFHYCFEVFLSPNSAKSTAVENHEYLVSEQKNFFSKFNNSSEAGIMRNPADFSLKVSVENIYEFNENLPYSGFRDRDCLLDYQGDSDTCNFKLHTTSWWHWGNKHKSYDIDTVRPIKSFQSSRLALIRPKFLFFPSVVIYSDIAQKYGIFSPKHQIVSFYLNDEFQGPYILKEKTDASFIAKSIRQPGFIISHNSKDMIRDYKPAYLGMTLDQYDKVMESSSMLDQGSWNLSSYLGTEFKSDLLNEMFEKLKHVEKLEEVFDLDYAAKQYALDSIFGINHRDNSINNSWFVNSSTRKFYYIPTDSGPFLFVDDYSQASKMDFTKLLLQNQKFKALVDRYLRYFVVEEKIYSQIKAEVLKYETELRTPINRIKLLGTVHPVSIGAMGSTELNFGTFFHSFTYDDFSNEAYLNLASLLKREASINSQLNENKTALSQEVKSNDSIKTSCTIENSKDLIGDIKLSCPKGTYEISENSVLLKDLKDLSLINVNTKELNREKIIFSNIENLRVLNYRAPSNSAGLVAIGVKKIYMENIEIDDVFGNGISIHHSEQAELKNVHLDRILKIGIDCSNVARFVRDSVVVARAYQGLKVKNCY